MIRILIVAAFAGSAATALAQQIDIKGLRIGMPEEEIIAKHGSTKLDDLTIAGAFPIKDPRLSLRNGRLDELVFYFDPADFSDVLSAVRSKYPKLKCRTSPHTTGIGLNINSMSCRLDVRDGTLLLTQFAGRIDTATLHILSRELGEEISDWAKKQKSDI